jgi:hypothetical protein
MFTDLRAKGQLGVPTFQTPLPPPLLGEGKGTVVNVNALINARLHCDPRLRPLISLNLLRS